MFFFFGRMRTYTKSRGMRHTWGIPESGFFWLKMANGWGFAMAGSVSDRLWSLEELVGTAIELEAQSPVGRRRVLKVIDGGKSSN